MPSAQSLWALAAEPPPVSAPCRWRRLRDAGRGGLRGQLPATAEMVEHITNIADIPVIATVVRCDDDAHAKVRAGPRFSTSPPARTRPRSYASCASTIPTCRSSRRAARRPRASVKPSPPAPTPSSGRRLRPSNYRPT
ncbi:MAG: hypothetical protein ACLTYW_06235 [Collinsella sp.]